MTKLEEAIQADDPSKPPVVYDYLSFKTWYGRYISKLVERRKQLARRSRLMTMSKLRSSTQKGEFKGNKGNKKPPPSTKGNSDKGKGPNNHSNKDGPSNRKPHPSDDLHRRGPAPSVTQNRHSNLFRPGPDSLKNRRCYNCDEVGHIAKDCPKPRRPRRQRPQWRDRVQSLVSELYSSKPGEDEPDENALLGHWQDTVGAFLSSVQWDESMLIQDEGSASDANKLGSDSKPDQVNAAPATLTDETTPTDHLGGANATLFDADRAYQAYHIGGYSGALSSVASVEEDSFTMLELWEHQWPNPIMLWVDYCSRAILPCLHKIRRAEGHYQCDITENTLSLIILSVSWLHAFVSSPLPHSFLELWNIAQCTEERATDAVTAHLGEIVQLEGATEALRASDLYSSMVASFRTMSDESFTKSLMLRYHTDVEVCSDPSYGSSRWKIPGPGEDFPVRYKGKPLLRGQDTLSGFTSVTPSKSETDFSPSAILPPPDRRSDDLSELGGTVATPRSSGTATPSTTPSKTPVSMAGSLVATPASHEADPSGPANTPLPGRETPANLMQVASSLESSDGDAENKTFTVLRVKHMPYRGSYTYVIWAQQVSGARKKGVRAVKYTHLLHVAKNHIQQAHSSEGDITHRLPSDLVAYDPLGVIEEAEGKNLKIVRGDSVSYTSWLQSLEDKKIRAARTHPESLDEGAGVASPQNEENRAEEDLEEKADEAQSVGEEENALDDMTSSPYRLDFTGSKKRKVTEAERPVVELLRTTKTLGVFLEASVGDKGVSTSWLFDPGCEVSQISWTTAQSVWSSITPVGSARLKCTMATSSVMSDLQLVRLSGFRLSDPKAPDRGGEGFTIDVMINPSLKVHPCVLGLNSISQLGLIVDYGSRTVSIPNSNWRFSLRPRVGVDPARSSREVSADVSRSGGATTPTGGAEASLSGRDLPSRDPPDASSRKSTTHIRGNKLGSVKEDGVREFTDQKRRQLTLRQSWTLKKFVAQKKAERYTPADRRRVKKAVHAMEDMEEEDELLLHRMAMSSLSAVEADGLGTKEDPILLPMNSSGEDSVLGATARPKTQREDKKGSDPIESWFSASESVEDMPSPIKEAGSAVRFEGSPVDLDESSGFLRVKREFDSPLEEGEPNSEEQLPVARVVSVTKSSSSGSRKPGRSRGKTARSKRCSHYAIADPYTWGIYTDWAEVQRLRPRKFKGFKSLHGAAEWLEMVDETETSILTKPASRSYFGIHGGSRDGITRDFGSAQGAVRVGGGLYARLDTRAEAAHYFTTGGMPGSMHLSGVGPAQVNRSTSRSGATGPYFSVYSGPFAGIYRSFRDAQNASIKGDGLYLRLDNRADASRFFRSGNAPIGMEASVPRPNPMDQVEPEEPGVDFGEDIVMTPELFQKLYNMDSDHSLRSAPSTLRIRVSQDPSLSGSTSRISTAVKEASELGSYMPVAFGDHLMFALYDSGASITQVSPGAIGPLLPYLEELDTDKVQFVSAENRSLRKMRLFGCSSTSLVQVESGVRSEPKYTLVVENPMLKSFPVLFGLRSMCDLGLITDHGHGIVRDPEGRPFRLYSQGAREAILPSLAILGRKWKTAAQRRVSHHASPAVPTRRTPPWQIIRRKGVQSSKVKPGKAATTPPLPNVPVPSNQTEVLRSSRPAVVPSAPLEAEVGTTVSSRTPERVGQKDKLPFSGIPRPPLPAAVKRTPPKVKESGSREPRTRAGWPQEDLYQAEATNDVGVFRRLVTRHIHPLQRFLIRHAEHTGRTFPNLSSFIQAEGEKDPGFKFRWNDLWEQHARWINKPSRRQPSYPVRSSPAETREGSTQAKESEVTQPISTDAEGRPSSEIPRTRSSKTWRMDPTPPHLTTPFPKVGDEFPDHPVYLQPDFYESLAKKARDRWSRSFSMWSQARQTFSLSQDKWYRKIVLGDKGRGAGHSLLVIPPKKQVGSVMKSLLDLRNQNAHTSALILLPEDFQLSTEVRTFLHAYCQRGEVYRYGALFSGSPEGPALHLNQCVSEYWFDGEKLSLASLRPSQRKRLDSLLEEFKAHIGDEFDRSKQPSHVPYVRLPVRADYEPASQAPFKKNPKMTQITIDFVRELERKHLISRCTDNEAQFVCNSLNIPKTDERYRFVCTFSDLNKNLIKDPYGMRTLDEVMAALEGCTWFTTIDLVDGFFSLPLYPADRGFTAFHTPLGLFKWEVLPQGTSASPAIFQRMMDRWFSAFLWKNVMVWIDDILVYSKTFEEHLKALRGVFEVLRKYGLVASRRKLVCCMRSVKYLGFIFGVNGIRANPDKLAAVHRIPVPSGRKQVRQFLGFANFYRRFLPPNFSTVIAPLTALTSEKNPFVWDASCQAAFNEVKLLLTSTPVLVHPDFTKPFHIHCDASGKGVGAVLSQFVNGAYRPIAFCSKKLLPHQQHWSPAQLEAYAVYHSVVEKWRYYLVLSKTIIHSDHRNLIWLMQHQHKGMIGRWYTSLTAFDLDISYVSGKSQMVADPLSRLFREVKGGSYRPESNPALAGDLSGAATSLSALAHVPSRGYRYHSNPPFGRRGRIGGGWFSVEGIRALPGNFELVKKRVEEQFSAPTSAKNLSPAVWASHQREDPHLGQIYAWLSAKSTDSDTKVPDKIRAQSRSYRLQGNLLFYRAIREVGVYDPEEGWALAVPHSLRDKVISECHGEGAAGHGGVRKTTLLLRQRYHFKRMRKAVAEFIRRCVGCRRAKSRILSLVTPLTPMVSFSPFNAVAIDLYQPGSLTSEGFRYVLTVVDLCTRWCMFYPLKTKYPAEVIAVFLQQWCHQHGLPQFILSDRGKEFQGVATTVCEVLDVKQIRTTPYHPRTNGLCESQHKMLTYELKIRGNRKQAPEWDRLLTEINFTNNVTPIESANGYSPFQMVFGRNPRLSAKDICFPSGKVPAPIPSDAKHKQYVQSLQDRLFNMRFRARESAVEGKQILRDNHELKRIKANPSLPAAKLQVGDIVCVYQPKPVLPKLNFQWSAPDHVVVDVRPNTCAVRSLTTGGVSVAKILSKVKRAGGLSSRRVNNKLVSSYPVPDSFFVGARVCKKFGSTWFVGVVDQTSRDEKESVWKVTYSDFDSEEVDRQTLASMLVHHPLLDTRGDVVVPEVGSFVWFSEDQQPRLGRVKEIDPSVSRPVAVHLYSPQPGASDISRARFRPVTDPETNQPLLRQLTIPQVILRFPKLSRTGFLTVRDRRELSKRIHV